MRVMRLVVLFALMVGMMPSARAMQCGDQNLTSQIIQQKAQKIQIGGKISLLKEDGSVVHGHLSAIGNDSATVQPDAKDGNEPVTVKFTDVCMVESWRPLYGINMPDPQVIHAKIAKFSAGRRLGLELVDAKSEVARIVSIGPDSVVVTKTDKSGKKSTSAIPYVDIQKVWSPDKYDTIAVASVFAFFGLMWACGVPI